MQEEHAKYELPENDRGLYNRYVVKKADGTPVDPRAEYFVLRLDEHGRDPIHIEACRAAAMVYADMIAEHLPKLAADLRERYGSGTEYELIEWHPGDEPPDGPTDILIAAAEFDGIVTGVWVADLFVDNKGFPIAAKAWADLPKKHRRLIPTE
jgi:hypothetical protein